MNFIKKQGLGTWLSILSVIIAIVGLAIYGSAVNAGNLLEIANGSQPFYDMSRGEDAVMAGTVVTCGILALVFIVLSVVLGQIKPNGILGTVCEFVAGALRIVVPVLLMLTFLYFLSGSFTGLGWTFFSNEELEIFPEAVGVGKMVITGLIMFFLASVAAVVAAYFAIAKDKKD